VAERNEYGQLVGDPLPGWQGAGLLARKGRNRDSDWLSIIDGEWPAIDAALQGWLAECNFDECGQ
jgi:hypothetical protein